jgi:hypothetical protein
VGPMVPQIGEQPDEDQRIFRPAGTSARAEVGRDQRVGGAFENEERQLPMVLIVMIIDGKLLLAIGGIIGMIEIEHDGRRRLWVAGNKVIHQSSRETIKVLAVALVFQTREGGRTRQVVRWVPGAPFEPQFEHRVMAETVGIIAVRIARGNLIDALR